MRRLVAVVALLAVALAAPAAYARSKRPAHPSKAYCKKHLKHLTKKQRTWCKRKHHIPRTRHTTTPPPPAPLTQPPAVDPTLGTAPATPVTTPTSSPAPTVTTARLAVSAKEFSLTLSRQQIAAGAAIVELQNNGEDPHNLRIEPSGGGAAVADFPITSPGSLNDQRLTLAAGTYKLYCTLSTHDAQGMHATLTVAP